MIKKKRCDRGGYSLSLRSFFGGYSGGERGRYKEGSKKAKLKNYLKFD